MALLYTGAVSLAQVLATGSTGISDIVVKLLAKDPGDRYQSADGLAGDLEICLAGWQSSGRIEPFPLGQTDVSDRLLLPQTLYGRRHDVHRLLHAFDEACGGVAQLLLISGTSKERLVFVGFRHCRLLVLVWTSPWRGLS